MSGNVLGLDGIDFVEFASPEPEKLHRLFLAFGFSRVMGHAKRHVDLYRQHDITFLLNRDANSFAGGFAKMHGPSIASMGWRAKDAGRAWDGALTRGAKDAKGDLERGGRPLPAVYGIGDSLIYLVDGDPGRRWESLGFVPLEKPDVVAPKGFTVIDHLTNNVEKGTMKRWASFYKDVFGFTEVRYFDIRGAKTGLTSYALRSPCGKFCIPINEADEAKSQINEYLDEYKGPGIQHLAFLTDDILASLRALEGTAIEFLDMDAGYYEEAFARVPNVEEDHDEIQRRNVLVDGDADGYLLQIFTKNLIGPIFIELIQRKNHLSFGEGNFGALFRSIEREQARRGVFGLALPCTIEAHVRAPEVVVAGGEGGDRRARCDGLLERRPAADICRAGESGSPRLRADVRRSLRPCQRSERRDIAGIRPDALSAGNTMHGRSRLPVSQLRALCGARVRVPVARAGVVRRRRVHLRGEGGGREPRWRVL